MIEEFTNRSIVLVKTKWMVCEEIHIQLIIETIKEEEEK